MSDYDSSIAAPLFNAEDLCDEHGDLIWVPEVVLGVTLHDVGGPEFAQAVSGRLRRLQATLHPDKPTGDQRLSR